MVCIERAVVSFDEIVLAMFMIDISAILIEHMSWAFTWFCRISHYYIRWMSILVMTMRNLESMIY